MSRHRRWLEVLETGMPVLVQDLGRPGLAALGVGRSGAADRDGYRLGARLLHHEKGEAALEVTFGNATMRAHGSMTLVLTGADTGADVDGTAVPHASLFRLRDGQRLHLGSPAAGLRTYVCVRGGIGGERVLGSRSTDTLSGVGPAPLLAGDRVKVKRARRRWLPVVDTVAVPALTLDPVRVRVRLGPRDPWIADPTLLESQPWTASSRSDRVGVRLEGGRLERSSRFEGAELPSEGAVRGAIQVPPGGEPVVFLTDHPVTGGYPVVAVVLDDDVDLLAQARPGQGISIKVVP